jgi:hypothetical protein
MDKTNNSILILDEIGKRFLDKNNLELTEVIHRAHARNPYFTEENCRKAISDIATNYLNKEKLTTWLSSYTLNNKAQNKTVGIVAAGNIPLVAIHDIICCLVMGANIKIKLSNKDQVLTEYFLNQLISLDSSIKDRIEIIERLTDFDAVIATGSDNTARYFEYYFKKYPHIIRGNRISIGILTGNESEEELKLLCDDIFTYFGLGCRNVSQLLIPQNFDFRPLISSIEKHFSDIINHHLYKNNLDYYRTIYLMNRVDLIDSDYINMVENESPFSPISCLHFHKYNNKSDIENYINKYESKIQCIVSGKELNIDGAFNFGEAQSPGLKDYADNIDTIEFLQNL